MNKDIIKGKWLQIKGRVKQKWAKLTDDDLRAIEGNIDLAAGRLQERYGHSKEEAERAWSDFCTSCADKPKAADKSHGA